VKGGEFVVAALSFHSNSNSKNSNANASDSNPLLAGLFQRCMRGYLKYVDNNNGYDNDIDNKPPTPAEIYIATPLLTTQPLPTLIGPGGSNILPLVTSILRSRSMELLQIGLAILEAVLELGSRSTERFDDGVVEELLAGVVELGLEEDFDSPWRELGEVAGHCLALIVSMRMVVVADDYDDDQQHHPSSGQSQAQTTIESTRSDLLSPDPPIRARGIVQLTKLVTQWVENHDKQIEIVRQKTKNSRKLITVVGGGLDLDLDAPPPTPSAHIDPLELFNLLTVALSDSESYVYLAAISGLSHLADLDPSVGLIEMASVLAGHRGLSYDVMAKVGEGLAAAARRRQDGLGEFSTNIVNLLCEGIEKQTLASSNEAWEKDAQIQIQIKINVSTRQYFKGGAEAETETETPTREDEKMMLTSGGGVYEVEKEDVCKASLISVLSEVVTVLNQHTLLKLVGKVGQLVVRVLRLEKGRNTRRAAALLARQIYTRAAEECIQSPEGLLTCTLCVELCRRYGQGGDLHLDLESSIEAIVKQSASGIYGGGNGNGNGNGGQGRVGGQLYDEALKVRCNEGLEMREECAKLGMWKFARGKVIIEEREKRIGGSRLDAVKSLLNE